MPKEKNEPGCSPRETGKTDQKQQSCIKLSYSIKKEIPRIWVAKHRERLTKGAEETHPQRPDTTLQGLEQPNPTPEMVSLWV